MSAIIVDPCHFTRLALSTTLLDMGLEARDILTIKTLSALRDNIGMMMPHAVFINDCCFSRNPAQFRQIIKNYPDTQFVILIDYEQANYREFVPLRRNIVILSKSARSQTLYPLLRQCLPTAPTPDNVEEIDLTPLLLSRSESQVLDMWMAGQPTPVISRQLNIQQKTVSLYKGNIRRKVGCLNNQVIHHVARLAGQLTSGIQVTGR
ncbi:transcriptional regulator RcsA [Chimaeribacter californicus]|uniref:Transcriptional regulator RcsA n=1 Tax=Chimaeribacter californicus TaxID=2060067 RepID=A0A2N5EF11_9GAMM|nr:transcriptional regulator RcsA [Chimaeribacter californicus]PLR41119.1 transcriptional regulator RcsA [Chimaeribacter californicus]